MFGVDKLVLSRPQQVKTVAKVFTQNIKNAVDDMSREKNTTDSYEKPVLNQHEPVSTKKLEKPSILLKNEPKKEENANLQLTQTNINNIRNAVPKVTILKPVAKSFLNQVNKIEEINPSKGSKERLIFSYSDSKGRFGKLENNGSRIKLVLKKKTAKDYVEEQIDIYNLNEQLVKQNGLFIQVKGWGNVKELSIANALKKSIDKFALGANEVIIYSYIVSSISSIADGGWECKVKVTPGKL